MPVSRPQKALMPSAPLKDVVLMRGDTLRKGRYRLVEQVTLPKTQQDQGAAWIATDAEAPRRKVLLRRVEFPDGPPDNAQQAVHAIASRFMELSRHKGFPPVVDVFQENGAYYLALQYPQGENLAVLLREQGGALPERDVAEYGRQLCEILDLMAQQQPPLIHGGISPETIIIDPAARTVSLILLPLFPPKASVRETSVSGYLSPEQARGDLQPSSDLYAVAGALHHAVTGFDPRERLAFFYPPARRLNPVISTGMETILARELRLSVPQRYARPGEMRRDLMALIASYPPVAERPNHTEQPAARLNIEQIRRRSRQKSMRNLGVVGGVGVVIIVFFLLIAFFPQVSRALNGSATSLSPASMTATATARQAALYQAAYNQELQAELSAFQKQGIGISDGRLVFDVYPGRVDTNLKKQAAQALQSGNMSTAVNLLNQAVSEDPTDGEAQIYNEDLHILQNNAPYVTIVVGLAFDNSSAYLEAGRGLFEAEYLAQHEVNTQNILPDGLKLRLLIANSSSNNDNVATVAQFIANRVSKDGNPDHIIGVMGWPYSTQTINARDIVAGVHLPIVSQTASSVKLSGSSPYFFRVNPDDTSQGSTLGTTVVKSLQARRILILRDPTDLYSASLADAFTHSVTGLGATVFQDTISVTKTSVDQYAKVVQEAASDNVDSIFLAGYNVDGVRLAHAVGDAARANPADPVLAHLRVIGGDAMGSSLTIAQGNGPDAQIVRDFPQDMQRLIFSSFADWSEWNFLGVPQNQQPAFFSEWVSTYQSSTLGTHAPNATYDALLSYDAVRVLVDAASHVHGTITGQAVRDELAALGTGSIPAYQGITGLIHFDNKGNAIDKAVVVLQVVPSGNGSAIHILQLSGKFR